MHTIKGSFTERIASKGNSHSIITNKVTLNNTNIKIKDD